MPLPPDGHVHSEWSWDAVAGAMEQSCARAVALGLPSIAFTEHVDFTRWAVDPALARQMARGEHGPSAQRFAAHVGPDDRFDPPPLDVDGYLACLQRCRDRYRDLRILSGVELGEPHMFANNVRALLATGSFDRALGSLHSLEVDGQPREVIRLLQAVKAPEVVRAYLIEAIRMIESCDAFAVLAHIDYPIRAWPAKVGAFDPTLFEAEYRAVLRALARSGRVLEVNTRLPLHPTIVRWWYEVGGSAVSFGSDAHEPSRIAHDFANAAAMVEAQGFRPGRAPHDFWSRRVAR